MDSLLNNQGLSNEHVGLYFVTFSPPSDTLMIAEDLKIDVFADNGDALLSDVYREGAIYSFYGEPSYAMSALM